MCTTVVFLIEVPRKEFGFTDSVGFGLGDWLAADGPVVVAGETLCGENHERKKKRRMRGRAYGGESNCLRVGFEWRCTDIQPVDCARGVSVRRWWVRRLALERRNGLNEHVCPLNWGVRFHDRLSGGGLGWFLGWNVVRSLYCRSRLLGRGSRCRKRSVCLSDGTRVL